MARNIITKQDVTNRNQQIYSFIEKLKSQGITHPYLEDLEARPYSDTVNPSEGEKEPGIITALNLTKDNYQSKLLKYIPAEIVALYVTLDGIVKTAFNQQTSQEYWFWLWIIFAVLLISTPIYLWRVAKVRKRKQLVISTIALFVWVFALGGAFIAFSWYKPLYGAIILPLYTFFVAILEAD